MAPGGRRLHQLLLNPYGDERQDADRLASDGQRVMAEVVEKERRLQRELLERRVMIDYRPGAGIRLAPHFYTLDDEVDAAIESMAEVSAAQ